MRVWRQASTVRNAGEEDEDHRDAHGKEGDEEHVGRAAVVVHAPIITYPGEDARGIHEKVVRVSACAPRVYARAGGKAQTRSRKRVP